MRPDGCTLALFFLLRVGRIASFTGIVRFRPSISPQRNDHSPAKLVWTPLKVGFEDADSWGVSPRRGLRRSSRTPPSPVVDTLGWWFSVARSRRKHVHRGRSPRRGLTRVGLATSAVLAAASPVAAAVLSGEISASHSPTSSAASGVRARTSPAPMQLETSSGDDLVMLADQRPDARPEAASATPGRGKSSRDHRSDRAREASKRPATSADTRGRAVAAAATQTPAPATASAVSTPRPSPTTASPLRARVSAPTRTTGSTQATFTQPTTASLTTAEPAPEPFPTTSTETAVPAPDDPIRACGPATGRGSAAAHCSGVLR